MHGDCCRGSSAAPPLPPHLSRKRPLHGRRSRLARPRSVGPRNRVHQSRRCLLGRNTLAPSTLTCIHWNIALRASSRILRSIQVRFSLRAPFAGYTRLPSPFHGVCAPISTHATQLLHAGPHIQRATRLAVHIVPFPSLPEVRSGSLARRDFIRPRCCAKRLWGNWF